MKSILFGIGAALVFAPALAPAQTSLSTADRDDIQNLAARYASALGACDGPGFADLFEPASGFFASGFRGRVQGRERLIALVDSERHCQTANADGSRGRTGGISVPTVALQMEAGGVFGIADLGGAAQYQDEYVKTADGWRFASRTVLTPNEMAAGLDAEQMAAIHALSDDQPTGDHYAAGDNGAARFLSSGVVITVDEGTVGGRVYLDDGSHYEDVYERTAGGSWRIRSRELVPAEAD